MQCFNVENKVSWLLMLKFILFFPFLIFLLPTYEKKISNFLLLEAFAAGISKKVNFYYYLDLMILKLPVKSKITFYQI